jgi:hypothetical protein
MGLKEVYLLGCDCTYADGIHAYEEPAPDLVDRFKDEASFMPELFQAYEVCKRVFESSGRHIYNATQGGKLEVFKRVNLEDSVKRPSRLP